MKFALFATMAAAADVTTFTAAQIKKIDDEHKKLVDDRYLTACPGKDGSECNNTTHTCGVYEGNGRTSDAFCILITDCNKTGFSGQYPTAPGIGQAVEFTYKYDTKCGENAKRLLASAAAMAAIAFAM